MRKLIAVVAAAGLSISGIAGSAHADVLAAPGETASSVDAVCTINGFTPSTVVLGLSPVTRTASVSYTDCPYRGWDLMFGDVEIEGHDLSIFVYSGAPQVTFSLRNRHIRNAAAGSYIVRAGVMLNPIDRLQRRWPSGFHLKRQSSWLAGSRFNAGPELVKKGRVITIQGTLSRANWNTRKYQGHGFQPVQVQFKTPTGRYATVKTVESAAVSGSVKTTVTAERTGFWRLVYRGNGTSGPIVAVGDRVNVN